MSLTPDRPALYVHVPFCAHKCSYCAFYSEASSGELIERYTGALLRELELVADLEGRAPRARTIFFGGGTPSILNLKQWRRILETMQRLNFLGADEWTVESNPATVSLDKASLWREFGVNRVSMGVQSLDENLLDRLGRIHSREMVFKSYDILRRAGFDNINLDLMFAIPGQTLDVWRRTLAEAIALGSEHLSCYEVIYEEDTPLFAALAAGKITPDEDLAYAMHESLIERAEAAGFEQYEIANFARNPGGASSASPETVALATSASPVAATLVATCSPACLPAPLYACMHNVNYWRGGSYYGLGPSAAGYVRGVRTKNWSNTQLYCERLECGERAIETVEELPALQRAGETAAFGLRMNAGWPLVEFKSLTGFDLSSEWRGEIADLLHRGWGDLSPERFRLTRQGLRFADAAAEMFLR